jgi:hypothetical protein
MAERSTGGLGTSRGEQVFYQRVGLTAWRWGPYSLSLAHTPQAKRGEEESRPLAHYQH